MPAPLAAGVVAAIAHAAVSNAAKKRLMQAAAKKVTQKDIKSLIRTEMKTGAMDLGKANRIPGPKNPPKRVVSRQGTGSVRAPKVDPAKELYNLYKPQKPKPDTKTVTKSMQKERVTPADVVAKRIATNPKRKITGKDSVTKAPAKTKRTELKERPRTEAEMRLKRNAQEEKIRIEKLRQAGKKESKGRAERQRDVDDQEVPQGQTIRGKFYPEGTAGIPARSTRTGNTIAERSPKVREDLPPKDELTAIKKAFAELTKEEKALMRIADERGIQGILREKILTGANKKPAGPKDAPIRKRLTPEERLAILKKQVRAKRKQNDTIEQRIAAARKKLTPAQRKAVAEAVARAKRNSK
jgi:hypothetical protein